MKNNKNAVYGIVGAGLALVLFCVMFAGCSEPGTGTGTGTEPTTTPTSEPTTEPTTGPTTEPTTGPTTKPPDGDEYITVSLKQLEFGPYEETRTLAITSNVSGAVTVSGPNWCAFTNTAGKDKSVKVSAYSGATRTGIITLSSAKGYSVKLPVVQYGYAPLAFDDKNDVKINVQSASSSENQTGDDIKKSYDGDMSTRYRSRDNGTDFPVTLTYKFIGIPDMDYLIYYGWPASGNNGNFQELEIWVADNNKRDLRKYGDFNFNGNTTWVNFTPPLVRPTTVEFRVKSGAGGFASCAEMEFHRYEAGSFDYSAVFTDASCSKLKEGVTREAIDAIPSLFFKDMALQIFLNIYDKTGFRAQEYRAWVHPRVMAGLTRTMPYSLNDNPTGIYVKKDDDLLVLAGNTQGKNVSIMSQDLSTGYKGTTNNYPLSDGLNRIKAKTDGLIYVQYYSDQGEDAPKIRLNFITGRVNGYFDSQKHQPGDWSRLLNAAVSPEFDLVGKFAHLTFQVSSFKAHTPDGKALIDEWDKMVRLEHEFMGLYKYNLLMKNRSYAHYDPAAPWMWAHDNHTGFNPGAAPDILNVQKFKTTAIWGPAHETGHMNQIRRGVAWNGMDEVTVNIYSVHVQKTFGNKSRWITDDRYNLAFDRLLGKGKPHNGSGDEDVPFWQLNLYLCDVLGTDFYKDLFHYFMTSPDPGSSAETDGRFQLDFVRQACRIANLDLTDFFDKWGFLTPIDKKIYSDQFTITQAQINALKAEIAAKNYPKPKKDFTGITDDNVNEARWK